jgi:hypothetical protein
MTKVTVRVVTNTAAPVSPAQKRLPPSKIRFSDFLIPQPSTRVLRRTRRHAEARELASLAAGGRPGTVPVQRNRHGRLPRDVKQRRRGDVIFLRAVSPDPSRPIIRFVHRPFNAHHRPDINPDRLTRHRLSD